MKTVAVIQARMGSTRLPGKMMADLAGRPLLFHIIERARAIRSAHDLVLATTVEPADDQLADLARSLGVRVVRGPVENVLERFRMALDDAEIVIRICGDAPLFDPGHLDRGVAALIEHQADLIRWDPPVPTAYQGAGVISRRALDWTWEVGRHDPLAYEHVTAYARAHQDQLRTVPIRPEPEMVGEYKLSIDTAEDLAAMRRIYRRLYRPGKIVGLEEVIVTGGKPFREFIVSRSSPVSPCPKTSDGDPKKTLFPQTILLRCDGSHRIGLGHVARCLALAEALRDDHGARATFAMLEGAESVEPEGFEVIPARSSLVETVEASGARALILDLRDELPLDEVRAVRDLGVLVATIDDPSATRLAADLAFYPPVPQVERMSWDGFAGERLVGWQWVVLRSSVAAARARRADQPSDPPALLITMGGSDPAGLTTLALRALPLIERPLRVELVLGPAFVEDAAFARALADQGHPIQIHRAARDLPRLVPGSDPDPRDLRDLPRLVPRDLPRLVPGSDPDPRDLPRLVPRDLPRLMAGSDLALASFGVTAYELAAIGVPALYLCLTQDHAESAGALVDAGMARSLGWYERVSPADLAQGITRLASDEVAVSRMRRRGPELIDGRGARRIAARIVERLKERDAS